MARPGAFEVEVRAVQPEAAEASSFELRPVGSETGVTARSGQFLTLHVSTSAGVLKRSYSISSSPELGEPLRITVKRVAGGIVSNHFLDSVRIGERLLTEQPAGRFVLQSSGRPLVAFAAGSGITPVFGLIKSALALTERPVVLFFANRRPDAVIFASAIEALTKVHSSRFSLNYHFSEAQGRVSSTTITRFFADLYDADVYLCGPEAFMSTIQDTVAPLMRKPDALFTETFASAAPVAESGETAIESVRNAPRAVSITLDGAMHRLVWSGQASLMDAIIASGLPAPHSCREGRCGTCVARLVEGDVQMTDARGLSRRDRERGLILTCRSVPTTDKVSIDFDV